MPARIRKGDMVEVTVGRSRGSRGLVLRVDPERQRVWVERVNLMKRHQRPTRELRQGGIIEREAPIHVSNVALVHHGERARVGFRRVGEKLVRWNKRRNEAIDG